MFHPHVMSSESSGLQWTTNFSCEPEPDSHPIPSDRSIDPTHGSRPFRPHPWGSSLESCGVSSPQKAWEACCGEPEQGDTETRSESSDKPFYDKFYQELIILKIYMHIYIYILWSLICCTNPGSTRGREVPPSDYCLAYTIEAGRSRIMFHYYGPSYL